MKASRSRCYLERWWTTEPRTLSIRKNPWDCSGSRWLLTCTAYLWVTVLKSIDGRSSEEIDLRHSKEHGAWLTRPTSIELGWGLAPVSIEQVVHNSILIQREDTYELIHSAILILSVFKTGGHVCQVDQLALSHYQLLRDIVDTIDGSVALIHLIHFICFANTNHTNKSLKTFWSVFVRKKKSNTELQTVVVFSLFVIISILLPLATKLWVS